MSNASRRHVLAAAYLLTAGALSPLWSQTWQQKYCTPPTNPTPHPVQCKNICAPGFHPDGPLLTPGTGKGEPVCRCVLNGTTPPQPPTPSYVHIHSVDSGSSELIVDQGPPYSDGTTTVYDQPVAAVGQTIVLNGCNFGTSGTIGVIDSAANLVPVERPQPTGNTPQPWSDTKIYVNVAAPMAVHQEGAVGSILSSGQIVVEAQKGNSNEVTLYVTCPKPAITSVTPGSTTPGGTVQAGGCGFLGSTDRPGTLTLQSTGTTVSTQSGPKPETIAVQSVSSWTNDGLTFQVPSSTPPGIYNIAINGTAAAGDTITVVASSDSNTTPTLSSLVGSYNPQDQQFTPGGAGNVPFSAVLAPLTSDSYGISPPSPQIWATFNTQTSIPVYVNNNGNKALSVPLQIWQDRTPIQCDPKGPWDGSPDGNYGQWVPLGTPQQIPVGTGSPAYPFPETLNPGVNYIALGANGVSNYVSQVNCTACKSAISEAAAAFQCNKAGAPYNNTNASPSAHPNNMIGMYMQPIYVLPVYTAALDAVPYSIIYQPPGDQSTSNLSQTITSTIQYKLGSGTKIANSSSDEQNTCYSAGLSIEGVGGSYKSCDTQTSGSESDYATQWTGSTTNSQTGMDTWPIGKNTSLVPSPDPTWPGNFQPWGNTYADEPFWYDGYVFLLNPEYAVYANGGSALFRLVPNSNTGFSGTPVPLAFLTACAAGLPAPSGPGFSTQSNPCLVGGNVSLTPQEAVNALSLDPFYPGGQRTDPTGGCSGASCRIQPINTTTISTFSENSLPTSIQYSLMNQSTSEGDLNKSYAATLTNVQSTTAAINAKLSGLPLSISPSGGMSQATTLTNSNKVTVSYQTSTIVTSQQTTQVQVQLSDVDNAYLGYSTGTGVSPCKACHAPLTPEPAGPFNIKVFQDNIFGTLLFQDPNAPPAPAGVSSQAEIKKLLPGILQRMQPYLLQRGTYTTPVIPVTSKTPVKQSMTTIPHEEK